MRNPRVFIQLFFVSLTTLKVLFRLLQLLYVAHGAIIGSQWPMRKNKMDCHINPNFCNSVQQPLEKFTFHLENHYVIELYLGLGRLLRCKKIILKSFAKIVNTKLKFLY